MPVVVSVSLKKSGKALYFDPANIKLEADDKVIVETVRGQEFGEVIQPPKELPDNELVAPLKRVIRVATREDIEQEKRNTANEKKAFKTGLEKIKKHGLPMKLVETECLFDGSKMIFYFTAEGRVDFRELVKDLASTFKTRIELRQIGVRDEAKFIGGLGPCGRDLCCRLFLSDFEPVSIKMAKEQNLPLNPIKISGICGRLMCCLKYETEFYEEFNKVAPKMGSHVATPEGDGRVVGYCAPKQSVIVEVENQRQVQVPLEDVKVQKKK
jgi:cell fate regulator YaaT (PSP1 superfamily)